MANIEQQQGMPPAGPDHGTRRDELRLTEKALGGSNATEGLIGAAATAMAVIGLAGVISFQLACIATIALGVALIIESAAAAARYQKLSWLVPVREHEQAQVGGGLTIEVIGGAAGVALGVLALLGIEGLVLLPIAMLVYGASFLLSGGVQPALETWVERGAIGAPAHDARRERIAHQAVNAGAGARALAGIAAAVLGILALADIGPTLTLTLVALLALGVAALLSGSAFSLRMTTLMHHR